MYFLVLFLYYFVGGDENGGAGPSLYGGAAGELWNACSLHIRTGTGGVSAACKTVCLLLAAAVFFPFSIRRHPARLCPPVVASTAFP